MEQELEIDLSKIIIGKRYRKELGNIEELAASIEKFGLLQPIVVDQNNNLIDGGRRIAAFQHLGRRTIPSHRIDIETFTLIEGEYEANERRKDFTFTEKLAIAKAIEEDLKGRWGVRHDLQERRDGPRPASSEKGETREIAAQRAGLGSGRNMRRVEAVVRDGAPELIEAMNEGKVTPRAAEEILKLPQHEQAEIKYEVPEEVKQAKKRAVPEPAEQPVRKPPEVKPDPSRHFKEGNPWASATFAHRAITAISQICADDPNALTNLAKIQKALDDHIKLIHKVKSK